MRTKTKNQDGGEFIEEVQRDKSLSAGCPSASVQSSTSRKGFGTVEIVLIIAVLISLALLFRTSITAYAKNLMNTVFNDGESICIVSGEDVDE
ncbi:MAG: Flp1 family type IVb pilin [Saccharofermentanales bacterium]